MVVLYVRMAVRAVVVDTDEMSGFAGTEDTAQQWKTEAGYCQNNAFQKCFKVPGNEELWSKSL